MKKENVSVRKNTAQHLAPGGRGWHAVPGEGVLKEAGFMGTPSSPLRGTSPAWGEVNRGFTLIELLVVVLIIGILAAVAVPQYQKAVVKSRLASVKALVTTVSNAAEVYYLAHGQYPTQLSELDVDIPNWETAQYGGEPPRDTITYPWGYCYLSSSSNKLFQCNNTQVDIGYIQRFAYSPTGPNTRACTALNENEIAIAVCKQETRNDTYSYQGDDGRGTIVESYPYL